uniref:ParB-related ThiF-related cassette protein E domain-containing protein n=1 Tax=mine drainage metagenome TaxID=410659 RepID=E6PXP0_9ZZZZ
MFKELAPYLRQRAVLLTVTHIDDDQIRVNVIPQKLKDGENAALTTPLTVTGTADELDRNLPATLVNFVSAHLQLRNTLDRAKAEMDAAAKTAQAEARSKAKTTGKKEPPKPETTTPTDIPKPAQPVKEESSRTASLFDAPAPPATTAIESDEEEEILAESIEDEEAGDAEEFDEAA